MKNLYWKLDNKTNLIVQTNSQGEKELICYMFGDKEKAIKNSKRIIGNELRIEILEEFAIKNFNMVSQLLQDLKESKALNQVLRDVINEKDKAFDSMLKPEKN